MARTFNYRPDFSDFRLVGTAQIWVFQKYMFWVLPACFAPVPTKNVTHQKINGAFFAFSTVDARTVFSTLASMILVRIVMEDTAVLSGSVFAAPWIVLHRLFMPVRSHHIVGRVNVSAVKTHAFCAMPVQHRGHATELHNFDFVLLSEARYGHWMPLLRETEAKCARTPLGQFGNRTYVSLFSKT